MVGRTFYKGCAVTTLVVFTVTLCSLFGTRGGYEASDDSRRPSGKRPAKSPHPLSSWTSRQTSRKLLNVVTAKVECRDVHRIRDKEAKCAFIRRTADCASEDGLLHYQPIVYCRFGSTIPLALFLLICWWLLCFIGLAVTADDFFCPSLVVISKTMRLSPNVAQGVTFLAFGNGAPDLFSAIASLSSPSSEGMGLGGLLGAGMFVTTVVVGTIAVIKPFKAMERPFLRDVLFYLVGVYWTFFVLWKGKMYIQEAIGFIALYVVYVVVVVVSASIHKKLKVRKAKDIIQLNSVMKTVEDCLPRSGIDLSITNSHGHLGHTNKAFNSGNSFRRGSTVPILGSGSDEDDTPTFYCQPDVDVTGDENVTSVNASVQSTAAAADDDVASITPTNTMPISPRRMHARRDSRVPILDLDEPAVDMTSPYSAPRNTLVENGISSPIPEVIIEDVEFSVNQSSQGASQNAAEDASHRPDWLIFLHSVNPVSSEDWPSMRWYARIYEVFKSPVVFIVKICCPVVNYDSAPLHNWSRYLQALQCFISPTLCVMLLQLGLITTRHGIPVYGITLVAGAVIAIVVLVTSRGDRPPIYHVVFGYIGFLISMVWIYAIANEIVNLLRTFGVVLDISNPILGLTLLAWGNSIGDWVADTVMARQGFARMGFAACFGAPFFNLQLGIGIPLLVRMMKAGVTVTPIHMTAVHLVLGSSLMVSLVATLLILLATNFKVRRAYGVFLLSLYVVFLVVVVLTETGVLLKTWTPW